MSSNDLFRIVAGSILAILAASAAADGLRAAPLDVVDMRAIDLPFERIDWPVLSPDSRSIVFSASSPDGFDHLYSVEIAGGTPFQITRGQGHDWSPRFSPDGTRIAFVSDRSGNRDIWVVPAAGGDPMQMTQDPAADVDPEWSPDGGRIAFASDRGGPLFLYQMFVSDRQVFMLTAGTGQDRRPAWSPDGRWIAFQSTRDGRAHVWLIPPEGGEARRLTRNDAREESWPLWMPGSDTLIIESGTPGKPGRLRMVPLDSAQGGPAVLKIPPLPGSKPGQGMPAPSLSRDGRRLLFVGTGESAIEVLPITGGRPATVVSSVGRVRHPSWDKEGRRLMLSSDMGGVWDIWMAGVASGSLARVTGDDRREANPQWSTNGGEVAYELSGPAGTSIHVKDPKSKKEIRFSNSAEGVVRDTDPAWSPDGRTIAFVSDRAGSLDIYVAPAGGGEPRRVTSLPGSETHPAWSPDGEWIAYAGDSGQGPEIWKVPVAGGEPIRLTRLKEGFTGDKQPAWSPSGTWLAFVRELAQPSGAADLYIIPPGGGRPFPFRRGSGARILEPAWSPDGKHLAYSISQPDQLVLMELGTPPPPVPAVPGNPGTPEALQKKLEQERKQNDGS